MKTSASKKEYEHLENEIDVDRANVEDLDRQGEDYYYWVVAECAKRLVECREELKKKCSDMHVSTLFACAESNLWLAVDKTKERGF